MLKLPIKYKDFNDVEVTEDFYFNLAKPEIIEFELEVDGGMTTFIKRIIAADNEREIIRLFKKFILLCYGEKSDDGKHFVKNDALREKFSQSAAYFELFMKLSTNANEAADFFQGVIPADMRGEMAKAMAEASPNPKI